MKSPPIQTWIIGHPIVMVPIELIGCAALYACWQYGRDGIIPGLLVLSAMAEAVRSSEQVETYKRWKQAWDSYDDRPQRRMGICLRLGLALVVAWTAVVAIAIANGTDFETAAIGWLFGGLVATIAPFVLAVPLRAAAWLFRRGGKRLKGQRPVKVVARCIVAPLSVEAAYDALPEHCQRIVQRPHGALT